MMDPDMVALVAKIMAIPDPEEAKKRLQAELFMRARKLRYAEIEKQIRRSRS